jgi:hypothetical protein
MLLRITSFAIIVFLLSCSKKPVEPPVGYVSFTANGTSYSWVESTANNDNYLAMYIGGGPGAYYFKASSDDPWTLHPFREVYLTFPAPNLTTTNTPFTLTNTIADPYLSPHDISVSNATAYDPFNYYHASKIGDYATVTITSVHDNRLDGVFTAQLHRASDSAVVNITNGTFTNVEIRH